MYNSFEEVLDNLAKKWDSLNSVQQSALRKAFAGTRQGENLVNGKQKRNKGWTAAKTLHTAMVGKHPHGGYIKFGGTPIWIEAMKVIDKEKINILKRMMIDSGIPIKNK